MNIELQKSTIYTNSVPKNCHFLLNFEGCGESLHISQLIIYLNHMEVFLSCVCVHVCYVCMVYVCITVPECACRGQGTALALVLAFLASFLFVRVLRCVLVPLALHGFWASELGSSHALLTGPLSNPFLTVLGDEWISSWNFENAFSKSLCYETCFKKTIVFSIPAGFLWGK